MSDKRKNMKTWLAAVCLAAVGSAMIPIVPAQAGMGTGNPPPPPPPPVKRSFRLYEGSTDSALTGKGFAGLRVDHTRSWVNGSVATTTAANGDFSYIVRSDQSGVVHRAYMFGLQAGWGSGDLIVATDAVLRIVVDKAGEQDFDELATPSNALVTNWRMEFEYQRGGAAQQFASNPSLTINRDTGERSFGIRRIPRHLSAKPTQDGGNGPNGVTKAVFQLKMLEGYDAGGTMRLKWLDKLENGRKAVKPGFNSDTANDPLVLHKILATTEK